MKPVKIFVLLMVFMHLAVVDAWVLTALGTLAVVALKRWVCNRVCTNVCDKNNNCHQVCRVACGWVFGKKRGMPADDSLLRDPSSSEIRIFPLPNKMSTYDKNQDGRISLAEFLAAFPKDTKKDSIVNSFKKLDQNRDRFIDCKEFRQVKFGRGRAMEPKC